MELLSDKQSLQITKVTKALTHISMLNFAPTGATLKQLLTIILLFPLICFGQKQANVWYFGTDGAGLDFNECNPTDLTDGHINGFEGCSSISDKTTGQFLFCTNSEWVWNRNQDTIPNSHLVTSGNTITQAMIIQKPGFDSVYYIITSEIQAGTGQGYRFHCIDMTMNGSLGGIVFKNSILYPSPVTEKITAVRHANGTDIWLIGHIYNSNKFISFLVTSAGINTTPVISQIGKIPFSTSGWDAIGELKASPDGTKLAAVTYFHPNAELFDFDNSTGQISNLITLPELGSYDLIGNGSTIYGLSFSPNNSLLYVSNCGVSGLGMNGQIIQYNITSNDSAIINSSKVIIYSNLGEALFSLKLAPNGKIYVAHLTSYTYLGVINSPDSIGVNCNYVDNGLSLGGKHCSWGLNNIMEYGYYCNQSEGIKENIIQLDISIYPNPLADKLNINCNDYEPKEIILYDLSSRKLLQQTFTNSTTINTEQLAKGMYLYTVRNRNGITKNGKVIKQ